jgi:predicted metal-binding membrane protein
MRKAYGGATMTSTARLEISPRTALPLTSQQTFWGVSALLFAASAALTIVRCGSMSMMWMRMPGQTWFTAAASFLAMWTVMMVAMMLPSVAPMLERHRQTIGSGRMTAIAGAGYFFVWALLGAAIFPLGAALATVEIPFATGMVILLAGLLQFTPWKARLLACCRESTNCAGHSAWRQGLCLGIDCACCCLGPTTVLLVVGPMDLRAMAVVTAAITAERLLPGGEQVARATGALAIAAVLFQIARAA